MIVLNIKLYMRKKWLPFIFIVCCIACSEKEMEKHQGKRDNVVDVRDKLIEIEINNVLFNRIVEPYIFSDYLVLVDRNSEGKLIHILDKDSFRYVSSAGQLGRGPGEITNMGDVEFDETYNQLLVTDHTKQCVFAYSMDSLLSDPWHFPYIKTRLDEKLFISRYVYISDTLSIGQLIEPTSNSTFREFMAKWNMASGAIEKMPYEHPDIDIDDKRFTFAVSEKYGLYVECNNNHDLMTICSLDGELKCNIYGDKWSARNSRNMVYYAFDAAFCGDKILALYIGENNIDDNGSFSNPTKFLMFDINGDYIKTLETGYVIQYFCYDEENNRVIMSLDDEMQFAYLDLNDLL